MQSNAPDPEQKHGVPEAAGSAPPPWSPPAPPANYPGPAVNPGYPAPPANYPGYPQPGINPAPPQLGPGYAMLAPPPVGYPGGPPVMHQPHPTGGAIAWMEAPQVNVNCPPGLEYLTLIDQLIVKQKVELLEAFTGYETQNKYSVLNSMSQKVYEAKEQSGICSRLFLGALRPFEMNIYDNFERPIIHAHRPLACQTCCYPCCLQTMDVMAPPGKLAGTVEQEWSLLRPKFRVKDAQGNIVLRIEGPLIVFDLCGEVIFRVLTPDRSEQVGRISKQWSGLIQELYTDADNFGISFPMDLDVTMKAVMLGACFLIDYMYFERTGQRNRNNRR